MTEAEYNQLLEILENNTIHNTMNIGGKQYQLIDLYTFKKELKALKKASSKEGILDLSKIENNIIKR